MDRFSAVPYWYLEIAHVLLNNAKDTFGEDDFRWGGGAGWAALPAGEQLLASAPGNELCCRGEGTGREGVGVLVSAVPCRYVLDLVDRKAPQITDADRLGRRALGCPPGCVSWWISCDGLGSARWPPT